MFEGSKIVIDNTTTIEEAQNILDELDDEALRVKMKLENLRENFAAGMNIEEDHIRRLGFYYTYVKIKQTKYEKYIKRKSKI